MKIDSHLILHCDAGWRKFSFLRIIADDGSSGFSEYNESYGNQGLSAVIEGLIPHIIGANPFAHERITSELYARTRQVHGGIAQQAIAAIENALLDLKARALEVPCYELLGGAVRDKLQLYWSHCGSYRLPRTAPFIGQPPITSLDDVVTMGSEVAGRGFSALKTNIFMFGPQPHMHQPGFARTEGWPALNPSRKVITALRDQLQAFRSGAGADMEIMLDLNFNYRTEGYLTVTRALDDLDLSWFEIDHYDPEALASVRQAIRTPLASCESLFGVRGFKPFFTQQAMDVAIIDVPWNGIWQSLKIAALAESFDVNIAPHNFYGHVSTLMSAHLCAAVPNFRIMEIDIDDVPWKDDLVTEVPQIENGFLQLPTGPGWGTELNEEAIRAHPVKAASSANHTRGMG